MLNVGTFLADRYEVIGKIGTGGMSDVYKAKDHSLGRNVAVKVLKDEFADDVNFVTKFRSEAQSAAGLEHPNIVNIYDVGSENGLHYIVMEYVEGITLKTYIEKKGQLTYKEAVSIAIQVGRGIEAAHNKNIIHRDIKPQNIIISTEGKVKVTDFGIARAASANTINSDVMGSVHYSSPEQARNGFVDGKSDVYSLGIVMYEMVTGRVPFDGDTTVAVAIQHLQEDMVSPSAYAPDLPISIEKVILKCTQKSADRRYESMADLLVDLKKVLISPNEDFVTMVPLDNDKTRVITEDELRQIQEEADQTDTELTDAENEEEDEDGAINPRMEKLMTILGIVAAIIIVIVVILIIAKLAGGLNFGSSDDEDTTTAVEQENEKVTMIDLTDMSYDAAEDALEELGLTIKNGGTVSSDTIDEGNVVSQDVEEGEEISKGSTVTVTLSSGAGEISVPDVTGYEESSAINTLEDKGLKYTREYEYSDSVESGKVISTDPAAGSSVKEGDTITITISQGVETVQVPDVTGKTKKKAKAALESAGLKLGNVTSEYSDSVAKGKVISQGVASGKYVDSGTSVSIVVSLGPETVTYSFSTKITLPESSDNEVKSANITLYDNSGNVLSSWNGVSASKFGSSGYSISVSDITSSKKGKLVIEWILEDGSTSTQTESVTFTKD
ncbi:Stk1 family PASTA domain-containing Ser/Thr kinase [Eubacterium oxidoreducens]|uniref:non-specific serine/threonine protein kinase n=1 Tax=Eubacterium oxidoreducens TaxID=1732 RepID=A0A1G6B652_EUBOX|nr:Stk1 family PASTA domain-containing Ser/Thr kinase [Eubacterium oxidoreducens]SDB16127.1 serine/threonine protein kinase [Eubacterium oxidoreducens]